MRPLTHFFKFWTFPKAYKIFTPYLWDRLWWPLWVIARLHLHFLGKHTKIVAVVGSMGKTTTKTAIDCALGENHARHSISNYGSGLARNILKTRKTHTHAAFEVAIAGPGRMASYAKLVRPNIAVVTSVASDHNRSFPTFEDTRKEKVKMVQYLSEKDIAILNGDDPNVLWMASQTKAEVRTFGFQTTNDIYATNIEVKWPHGTKFTLHMRGQAHEIQTQLFGKHMVYPFLAAISVALANGVALHRAIQRLQNFEVSERRLEKVHLPNDVTLLVDDIKASVESYRAAIETLGAVKAARRIAVLGDVDEPPGNAGDVYRELGAHVGKVADRIYLVGTDNLRKLSSCAKQTGTPADEIHRLDSRPNEVINRLRADLKPGDVVLIKGAGSQRFHRIALALQSNEVTCDVKYCAVRMECKACPLLKASQGAFENYFIGFLTKS